MTIVFVFSGGVDLSPFTRTPVPASLISFDSGSAFDFQLKLWKDTFPDCEIIALDMSEGGRIHDYCEGIDTFSIPGAGNTMAAFVLTAMSLAYHKDTMMIFVPGDIVFHDYEKYFSLIRSLINSKMNEYIAFQFGFEHDTTADFYYQKAYLMDSQSGMEAFRTGGIIDSIKYLKLKSENPDAAAFPLSGIVMLHSIRFLEYLGHHYPVYNEIILDLAERFSRNKEISVELSAELNKQLPRSLAEFLSGECLLYKVEGGVERIRTMRDCFLFIGTDENQNHIEGPVKVINTHSSIILNSGKHEAQIRDMHSVLFISDGKRTLVQKI